MLKKKKRKQVKEAAEAMFGPLGKSDKPTPKPEAEVLILEHKKKVEIKEL